MGFRFAEASRHVQHNPLPWVPDLLLRTAARVRLSLLIHESFPWPGTVSTAFPAAMYTHNPNTIVNCPELADKQRLLPLSLVSAKSPGQGRSRWITMFSQRCRSEEHTSELQSRRDLVCRLLLEKKKKKKKIQ